MWHLADIGGRRINARNWMQSGSCRTRCFLATMKARQTFGGIELAHVACHALFDLLLAALDPGSSYQGGGNAGEEARETGGDAEASFPN